jgi:hypothetical protein
MNDAYFFRQRGAVGRYKISVVQRKMVSLIFLLNVRLLGIILENLNVLCIQMVTF